VAARGDRLAQYELADRYAEGRGGLPHDMAQAMKWFSKAAAQNLPPAQYRLAVLYEKGLGTPRDVEAARKLYAKAAEAGNVRAMHNLAVLTADVGGNGKPDYATAAQWFRKAADHGVRDSQYNLAILYARGLGVPQSFEKSYFWFGIAATQGDQDAGKKRDEIGNHLDAAQITAAKAAIAKFKAQPGDVIANDVPTTPTWDAATRPTAFVPPAGRFSKV
jgi:localization factor PodJL